MQGQSVGTITVPMDVYNALRRADANGGLEHLSDRYEKEIAKSDMQLWVLQAIAEKSKELEGIDASGDVMADVDGTIIEIGQDRDDEGNFVSRFR
ncbi:hypothetical protein [Haladaptatus caseinilyticus]|uniref:hypothetical protein n=1 Tax=Haladaptatus caseinilyticus TaxID=2993314 RepID=UPI00224A5B47|nr:hypothetical protein [Haladaptatus caseinilyticus]